MKKLIGNNPLYLATAAAVISSEKTVAYSNTPNEFYATEISKPLGTFLVYPIKNLKIFREFNELHYGIYTIGFREANTRKKIISNTFIKNNLGSIDGHLHDIEGNIHPMAGDIYWNINEEETAQDILGEEIVENYFHISKKEMKKKLQEIRALALELGMSQNNDEAKKLIKR